MSTPHAAPDATSGQLYAFGDNYFGQLGNATGNGTRNPNPTPAQVTLPGASGPVTQIVAGGTHSLEVTSAGQAYAFGDNSWDQLGSATNDHTHNVIPTPTRVTLPPVTIVGFRVAPTVTQIAAGDAHSLALSSMGWLYAFGNNRYGQLGSAINSGPFSLGGNPAARVRLPGATGPVTQIAAGARHSLAVTSTGQLYAFGDNYYGQLGSTHNNGIPGDPVLNAAANPTPTLVALPGARGLLFPTRVTQIAAGAEHTLALTSIGALYAFGDNRYGQLGNTTNNGNDNANPTPTLVELQGQTGPVTQIAAGADHSLVLTSTGQLYAFGYNGSGQLGNATNNYTYNANPTPTLVELPGATGPVTQIAAGKSDSLALTSTGQLYAFGDNRYGQLGSPINNYTDNANPTPTLVPLPAGTSAVAVAPGSSANHTLMVLTTPPPPTPPSTTPSSTTPQPPNPLAPNPTLRFSTTLLQPRHCGREPLSPDHNGRSLSYQGLRDTLDEDHSSRRARRTAAAPA
jgi:alpha-tubulin suppressor-like RCC1 family protein